MFVPSTAIIKFWILLSCANLWQSENLHQMKKIFGTLKISYILDHLLLIAQLLKYLIPG